MRLADVRMSRDDGLMVGAVTGEIDMSNAMEIRTALTEGTPNEAAGLVLDLTELDYLDSAGIQLLFQLDGALRSRSQGLVLLVLEESTIAETFRMAGVTSRIEMTADRDRARGLLMPIAPEPA